MIFGNSRRSKGNNEVAAAAARRAGGMQKIVASVAASLWITLMGLGMAGRANGQAPGQTQTPPPSTTQTQANNESRAKIWGDYDVQQSAEVGYRDSMIGGNLNNYNTFENLATGWRLFDYTVSMRSIDHKGLFFDNLTFSNFGYGGDPNDVSRLRVQKNKIYDFRALFRRDKNIWNYNLLGNPLNPSSSNPAIPVVSSPQALDLTRKMQDYDLTLLPESRVRFRLGFTHNINNGPAAGTVEGGTEPLLSDKLIYTSNAYRMGVDYRGIPRTTLSFDEFLIYSKVDTSANLTSFPYQLSNGTPVNLGLLFNTVGNTPCAAPITNAGTTPPMANANCNGYLAYGLFQNPRSSFPTEHFSFQSAYFKNLSMVGSVGYASGNDTLTDLSETINAWTSRTAARGSTLGGPTQAKRVTVNADWSGDYHITDKMSINDEFSYNNWRIPSMWATVGTQLFATPPSAPGQAGLLLPISTVTTATFPTVCPTAPYNGPGCPQHTSSSLADVTNELVQQFLGQNIRENTIELQYDFTRKISARIGYFFRARTIADFSSTADVSEIYLPGGASGNAGNDFLAARADCAKVGGVLPAACSLNAATGAITEVGIDAGSDAARNLTEIHEHALLVGVSARPTSQLRFNADLLFGSNDNSFTRISPRQLQSYKVHGTYTPTPWASIDMAADIHENRDNVSMVNNLEHGRTFSFVTTLSPNARLWVDFGYHFMDIFMQTEICFADTGSTIFTAPCPVPAATGPLGTLALYTSRDHYAYGDVMWKPYKRVTALLGYSGSIVRGNATMLNKLQPTGPLDFNYLRPFVSLEVLLYKGVSYKTAWNYYGYNDQGVANPAGLAPLPLQDFNGSNVTFSLKYSF